MTTFEANPQPDFTSPDVLARQLDGFAAELQQTKDWFQQQMDAQIAQLNSLRERLTGAVAPPAAAIVPMSRALAMPPSVKSVVITAPDQPGIDPHLEQATLEELNQALSLAFTEIASRGGMIS
jgi:hypothetical protein